MNHYDHKNNASKHFSMLVIFTIACLALAAGCAYSIRDGAVFGSVGCGVFSIMSMLAAFDCCGEFRKSNRMARDSKPIKVERL